MKKDLGRLRSLVKKKKKSVLNKVIHFFARSSYDAYLVGGFVRDTILGKKTNDIDISVQGDAMKAGYSLNRILKGKIKTHKEFRTISIFKDNIRIDLATARKEVYPFPGALPKIAKSNIYEDLRRRDFSINAIAVGISKNNFGDVFDPFDGIGDINRGLIRILHKRSFIDDPTRIFRALRYKNRFNFELDPITKRFLKDALSKTMIEKISKQRVMNELKLIFTEENYLDILYDLQRYGIFKFNKKGLKNIGVMGNLRYYYFLCLIDAENFPLSNQEKKIINDLRKLNITAKIVREAKDNSTLFYALKEIDKEVINRMCQIYPDLNQKIQRYYSLKKIKPLLNGKDLKKIKIEPGPQFREILTRIYKLQLNGKIKNKKLALTFLKNG
ncbi:MAG: CCA tRNA nucleotidyltransferase [bacterium]